MSLSPQTKYPLFILWSDPRIFVRRSGQIRRKSHDLVLRYRHLKMGIDYTNEIFFVVFKRKIIHFYNISNQKGCWKQHSSLIKLFCEGTYSKSCQLSAIYKRFWSVLDIYYVYLWKENPIIFGIVKKVF